MKVVTTSHDLERLVLTSPEYLGTQSMTCDVPVSTGAQDCILLANDWIQDCQRNHTSACSVESSQFLLPTRLIDVGCDNFDIRLYETSSGDAARIKYLALSHCWGTEKFTTLSSVNHKDWGTNIEYIELPKTFQDAIRFTRDIGERYVWIDSLCIIQDCDEDWECEAKKMSNVYAGAYCTISASGSSKVSEGCFKERIPFLKFPCNLLFSDQRALRIHATHQADNAGSFSDQVDGSPLSKRGWVFQERLLSRRIVHFGADSLFFECRTHIASELLRSGEKYEQREETSTGYLSWRLLFGIRGRSKRVSGSSPDFSSSFDPVSGSRAAFNTLRHKGSRERPIDPSLQHELHSHWFELVARYTSAKLTKVSDRLIAIDGIAKQIQREPNPPKYLAGLWEHHLLFDLLWYLKGQPQERAKEPRAPSWSWGVVDAEVCENLLPSVAADDRERSKIVCLAEVCDVEPKEFSSSKFGGYIDIKCPPLLVIEGEKEPKSSDPENPNGSTKIVKGHSQPFEVEFVPDIDPIRPPSELLCAEIARVAIPDPKSSRDWLFRSHGIVLRRNVVSGVEPLSFERVGRFWVEMRMSYEEVSKDIPKKHRGWKQYPPQTPDEALEAWSAGRGCFSNGQLKKVRII